MTTTIKVLRENVIKALSNIKDDNVSIADVVIERRKLLEALKLQTQEDADILTINYGKVSYQDSTYYNKTIIKDYKIDNEPCIQFSCNHTTMRFLNRPNMRNAKDRVIPQVIPLNFVDHLEYTKPEMIGIPIDTEKLMQALSFVIHGVETDDSREALECVLFDCKDDTLSLVTADGFRLPVSTFNVKGIPQGKILIHRTDIPKLLTFLKSNIEGKGKHKSWLEIYMSITDKTVKFMSDKGMVEFDKQDGTYPNYSLLIPTQGTHIEVYANDMLEAVKALTPTAKDGSGIIRMQFEKHYPIGKITLSSKSEDLGDSSVECDAKVEGDCKIAVNAKYLIDFLTASRGNMVDLFITTPSIPFVAHNGIDQFETIMPMFVQW